MHNEAPAGTESSGSQGSRRRPPGAPRGRRLRLFAGSVAALSLFGCSLFCDHQAVSTAEWLQRNNELAAAQRLLDSQHCCQRARQLSQELAQRLSEPWQRGCTDAAAAAKSRGLFDEGLRLFAAALPDRPDDAAFGKQLGEQGLKQLQDSQQLCPMQRTLAYQALLEEKLQRYPEAALHRDQAFMGPQSLAARPVPVPIGRDDGSPARLRPERLRGVLDLVFSPDGQTLAVSRQTPLVELWSPLGSTRAILFGPVGGYFGERLGWPGAGEALLLGSRERLLAWNPITGELQQKLQTAQLFSTCRGKDGFVALQGNELRYYQRPEAQPPLLGKLDQAAAPVHALACDEQGVFAAAGDGVHAFSYKGAAPPRLVSPVAARAVAASASLLAIGEREAHWRLLSWDRLNGRAAADIALPVYANRFSFSPSGRWLAIGGHHGELLLWDVKNRRIAATAPAHADAVTAIAYRPDGRVLATGGPDGLVKLWQAQPLRLLAVLLARCAPPRAAGPVELIGALIRDDDGVPLQPQSDCQWAVLAENGDIDGSKRGYELFMWQTDELLPGFTGWAKRSAPGLLRRLLGSACR